MSQPVVFVCGVTGIQGGSVARELRESNVEVHALARNISSQNAKAVEALGVKLWAGDFDNTEAITAAMAGCSAVFLNFMPDFNDIGAELRWAKSIFAAAHAASVQHVVYSSGFIVNTPERNAYWDPDTLTAKFLLSKQAIENETQNAGFKYWTILRPGNFMSNYIHPHVFMFPTLVEKGIMETALTRDTILPCVDPLTVGRFGRAALLDPVKFHAQGIEYADELLKLDDILDKYSAATGRTLQARYLSDAEIQVQRASNPFIQGQLLCRDMVKFVDMDNVKQWGVPLSTLAEFLEREKTQVLATYSQ